MRLGPSILAIAAALPLAYLFMVLSGEDPSRRLCHAGPPVAALVACSAVINGPVADPNPAWAYSRRGIAFSSLGALGLAEDDFSREIAINPDYINAYFNRASVRLRRGDVEGAIRDSDAALQHNSDRASTYSNRGYAHFLKREYDLAAADESEAIMLDQRHSAPYENRALAYYARHEFDAALVDLDEAIRLQPDFEHSWRERGNVKLQQRNYEGAAADYDAALKLDPSDTRAHLGLGYVFVAANQNAEAIDKFNAAIGIDAGLAPAYFGRARAKAQSDDPNGAREDMQQAIRLEPDLSQACPEFPEALRSGTNKDPKRALTDSRCGVPTL